MRPPCVALLLGLVAPLVAQSPVTVQYFAGNTLSAAAGGATNTLPAGTDLAQTWTRLDVASPVGLGGAVLQVNFQHSPLTGTSIQLHESSNMQTPSLQAGTGSNETVLVLTAQQAVPANVILTYSGASSTPANASALTKVDIGDDGSFELNVGLGAPTTLTLAVTIPPQGLRIRTVMQALMYLASRFIETGRRLKLGFGRRRVAVEIFCDLYHRLAYG